VTLERRREGKLVVAAGASRSGKTMWTAQQVARARRLLVWDTLNEWSTRYRCARITTLDELVAVLELQGRFAFHHPAMLDVDDERGRPLPIGARMFSKFCGLAWCWLRLAPGALVVEETADVTTPQKAPPAWGTIIRKGLRYGVDLYALTQRPAESDKTAFGNASLIHAGRAVTPDDRATLAKYLDMPLEAVAALRPLDWLERCYVTGVSRKGRVSLTAKT
jgi:hypothetical protein